MPRLFRLMAANDALMPFLPRRTRRSSPRGGRSTLMTSAPRSARKAAQYGPAMTRERSRTRMPSSMLMPPAPGGPSSDRHLRWAADEDLEGPERVHGGPSVWHDHASLRQNSV